MQNQEKNQKHMHIYKIIEKPPQNSNYILPESNTSCANFLAIPVSHTIPMNLDLVLVKWTNKAAISSFSLSQNIWNTMECSLQRCLHVQWTLFMCVSLGPYGVFHFVMMFVCS